MALLPIDSTLLDLHGIDEDESEAVALCLVEFLFAETNAHYRQHCLAREALKATAERLTDSVFDAIACAHLQSEDCLDASHFAAEPSPIPEINDRHAARCVPHRSPGKQLDFVAGFDRAASVQPTQRSRAESHQTVDRSRMSLTRRRPKPGAAATKTNLVTIPQVIHVAHDAQDEEDPMVETWRQNCLKELDGGLTKKTHHGGNRANKYEGFTRQSPLVEPRVSLEVEVIDSAPPLLRHEISGSSSASAVKMKSSLNTFCSIYTPRTGTRSHKDNLPANSSRSRASAGAGAALSSANSKRNSMVGSQSAPTLALAMAMAPRKATTTTMQLNDSLTRKRSTISASPSAHHHPHHSVGSASASSASVNPWRFDEDALGATACGTESLAKQKFTPDLMVASAASIPTSISLSAGVELTHGETISKGPERREKSNTMSRKRFELHQRLATDILIQESALLQPASPSSSSSCGPASSPSSGSLSPISSHSHHSHHHHRMSPRPYETVPADPLPVPTLSRIGKDALVIPRNHLLAHSASTPSLRVRNPSARRRHETPTLVSTEELDAMRKARPTTALGAIIASGTGSSKQPKPLTIGPLSSSASAKYLREFPKPHAGTIKLNARKAAAVVGAATGGTMGPDVDSARQRMAWIS